MVEDITIIVVAYNREDALKRCLRAISQASYSKKVHLIISIDRCDSNIGIQELADDFAWEHGPKKVIYQSQHLGLREHILKCGDLSQQYGTIIVLEDDIYVSPYYYNFATQAAAFYRSDQSIAGISLYSPQYNETAGLPFEPLRSNFDIFFGQFPSSWGQVWTPEHWKSFRAWYSIKSNLIINTQDPALPHTITKRWPETSWKKYFFKYMIENDKYFVYPYVSLSTNFSDAGTHVRNSSNKFQVPLCYQAIRNYHLCKIGESNIIYDAFCENIGLKDAFAESIKNNLTVDLYATKNQGNSERYVLTTREMNFRIIKSYALAMKPVEDNIRQNIEGYSIFLYDTTDRLEFVERKNRIFLKDYFRVMEPSFFLLPKGDSKQTNGI